MSVSSALEVPHGLTARRVAFDWSGVEVDRWHTPHPEFAAGANAISLLMPHAEPFVIAAVRSATSRSDGEAREWIRQEAAHAAAHRVFNNQLTSRSRVARALDRMGAWMFRRLANRSEAFGLAFAAAFELVAFASARWAEAGLQKYFRGADETAATLFLWHLAEEVEHKGVVHELFVRNAEARRRYPVALLAAFVALIGFTIVGGLSLFCSSRHVWNPVRWVRLIGWGLSLAFVLLPVLAMSLSEQFDPASLVDPPWMAAWLREYDPVTETMPLWTAAGGAGDGQNAKRSARRLPSV